MSQDIVIAAMGSGGALWAVKQAIGPAITAFGESFGDFTKFRADNLFRLNDKVAHRIEATPLADDAEVHPRVARSIIQEASWTDDPVTQEYFAGMLIGARGEAGAEGEAGYYSRLAANLSATQLRLHHLAYRTLLGIGPDNELRTLEGARKIRVHIPMGEAVAASGGAVGTLSAVGSLYREGLIGEYAWDGAGSIVDTWFTASDGSARGPGFAFTPTTFGANFFLRAYGHRGEDPNILVRVKSLPTTLDPMPIAANATYSAGVIRA